MSHEMNVHKRNGTIETVHFDKILNRVKKLGTDKLISDVDLKIQYTELVIKVIEQLYDGIETRKIDELTAEQCASLSTQHPDYGKLASRILVSNHHKNTLDNFGKVMHSLFHFVDSNGNHFPLISEELYNLSMTNEDTINQIIDYNRDYFFDYFGFKTLERGYLMRINNKIVERPQHLWMRVALCIHKNDFDKVKQTYDLMSEKYFTHATPTLFNAGTPRPQLSSCYLLAMEDDSITGIYNTLGECASISKWAGGIGLHIHNVRANGAHIRGTNGSGNGIVPMLRVFNNTARYVNQGGKRNGSFAIYLEPWHADIEDFLQMKKNHGDEEMKGRDLFYALWVPDLFMKRVKDNKKWTLMCPNTCKGLSDCYGEEFDKLYLQYENDNRGNKVVNARDLWFQILSSQIETGTPYLLYKDSANRKSNQKNLGIIKSSNLCTEIIEYSNHEETAVCNLASIGLSKFVKPPDTNSIHHVKLYTKTNCTYCKLSKVLLKRYKINYEEIVLDNDDKRNEFYEQLSKKLNKTVATVPQIYINDTYIGGYNDLVNTIYPIFDYDMLHKVTKAITINLNKVIDINFYPTIKTKRSNYRHRPIGIGVQGLADVFALMDIPFDSDKAKEINKNIFETIYHASLESSMEIAKKRKQNLSKLQIQYKNNEFYFTDDNHMCVKDIHLIESTYRHYEINSRSKDNNRLLEVLLETKPIIDELTKLDVQHAGAYSSFEGSPLSKGVLQFDMWNISPSDRYNWEKLRNEIKEHGIRNSLLVAPMPTASTSQILGNNECFEPFTNNIYLRRTLAGEFIVLNKYLLEDLLHLGIWNNETKNSIIENNGSVQHLDIPYALKEKYKIVWEISMKSLIDMARDRGAYICQSQSLNLWQENPTSQSLTAMHFYAWSQGLKTGMYYLRTKAKASAQKFTIDPSIQKKSQVENEVECLMCSG